MDDDRRRRFVLQAMDERTGAPCLEALLWIADLPELRSVLADEAQDDPHLRRAYELTPNQLAAVGSLAEPPFSPDQRLDRLEPWHCHREAPYLVHTGYELALMIDGRKPLAVFGDVYPTDWLDETMSRFDLFVEQRRFVRKIVDKPLLARYPLGEDRRWRHLSDGFGGPRGSVMEDRRLSLDGRGAHRVEREARTPAGYAAGIRGMAERLVDRARAEAASAYRCLITASGLPTWSRESRFLPEAASCRTVQDVRAVCFPGGFGNACSLFGADKQRRNVRRWHGSGSQSAQNTRGADRPGDPPGRGTRRRGTRG
jgi:hypothetical protein